MWKRTAKRKGKVKGCQKLLITINPIGKLESTCESPAWFGLSLLLPLAPKLNKEVMYSEAYNSLCECDI